MVLDSGSDLIVTDEYFRVPFHSNGINVSDKVERVFVSHSSYEEQRFRPMQTLRNEDVLPGLEHPLRADDGQV